MRRLRLALAWTAVLTLLGGMGGTVSAQETDVASFDGPHRVTGQITRFVTWTTQEVDWNEERQVEERSIYVENPITMDDPHLSGLLRREWNYETYGGTRERGLGEVMAGRAELVTDGGGSWVGITRGYVSYGPRSHFWQFELTGTGAFEGHTALLWTQGPGGGPHAVEGFVFPGPLPDYPAELPVAESP